MKKLLLLTFLVLTFSAPAQSTQKQIDLSIKIHKWIDLIKENDFFNFIGNPPEKMFEIYNCDGSVDYYNVKGVDYSIEFHSNNVVICHEGNKFFLTMINNDFVGHGCTLDTRAKRMTTYYFQNNKIKKSVKSYNI